MKYPGFTLLEVVVVGALLAVLSVFALPTLRAPIVAGSGGELRRARTNALRSGRAVRMLDTGATVCASYISPDGMVLADTTATCSSAIGAAGGRAS